MDVDGNAAVSTGSSPGVGRGPAQLPATLRRQVVSPAAPSRPRPVECCICSIRNGTSWLGETD